LASLADLDPDAQQEAVSAHARDAEMRARRAEALVRIGTLRQLCARGKLAAVKEWVENFLASGDKLVLFAHHVDVQQALFDAFPNAARLFGEDDATTRQANIDRFQSDPDCRLIVCSLVAGGVGVTLTAASNVAFVELSWTPAAMEQAEDRVHRIGQHDAVTAWYFLAEETIDEWMYDLLESKRQVIDHVIDGRRRVPHTLQELLERLAQRAETQQAG